MKAILDLIRQPLSQAQSLFLQVLSLVYSGFVMMFTAIDPTALEVWARIAMYITASLLSLVTIYFTIKNKGKRGKR